MTSDANLTSKLKSRNKFPEDKAQRYTTWKTYDDNVSLNSRNSVMSTKSIKQKYLRGVSINNNDHYQGLAKKESDYK